MGAVEFEESYVVGSGKHRCSGIKIRQSGLAEYLANRVQKRHYGLKLINELMEKFPDIRTTDFGSGGLAKIRPDPKPWEVGESFSECLLEDYKGVRLPYFSWQDLKNQNASPTGADLVGYDYRNGSTVFLFGEVKTSTQIRCPPSVVNNLRRQLQDLGSAKTSFRLVFWLGLRSTTQEDRRDFGQALKSYAKYVFKIIGVLIRDTVPDKRDLEGTFAHLADVLSPTTTLEMLAVYLPVAIDDMPRMMDGGNDHG